MASNRMNGKGGMTVSEAGRKGGIASQRRKQDGGEAPGSSGENARGPQEMYANGSDEM